MCWRYRTMSGSSSTTSTLNSRVIGLAASLADKRRGRPTPPCGWHRPRETSGRGLRLRLLRRRLAERSVAGAAGVATEILHDLLRQLLVLGLGRITELLGLDAQVLGVLLELGPLLPDFGLGLRLVGERALGEQARDLLGGQRERLRVHRDGLDVPGL